MALFDDEPGDQPNVARGYMVGEPLDTYSVAELTERIADLKAEIARLEEALSSKQASLQAAASLFKS